MAFLKVVEGSCPGQILELNGERVVLGRHPNCEIVLDNKAVSRHHAQILESHGNHYLEDLRSRNRTYLNSLPIAGRTELHDHDRIKVCDVMFSFHRHLPSTDDAPPSAESTSTQGKRGSGHPEDAVSARGQARTDPDQNVVLDDDSAERSPDSSSILGTVDARSSTRLGLGVKPEAKLRAVLDIGKALANLLRIDDVLQAILDGLFQIYPQADEGFVLLKEPVRTGSASKPQKLLVKATKFRGTRNEATFRLSTTVVRQAMETGEAILSADAAGDARFEMSESLSTLRIRSMMCVPLIANSGDVLGVIQIDTKDLRHQFSQDDLEMLVSVASQASLAVENASLHEELLEQRNVSKDLEFATQVQLGFLPHQPPKVPGYEFDDYYEAALRVGGDYFDYIPLPDGRIAVALGDVAGKGVPAALLMARLYSAARYHLLATPSAAAALTGLNTEIVSSGLGHRFITCVIVVIDPKTHEVAIANAGHLPPLLRGPARQVRAIGQEESGLPLGILPDQQFTETQISLQPGDGLTLLTDGITEAMNSQNECYGRHRLNEYLVHGPEEVEPLVAGIIADVEKFCEGLPQRDDTCLVCLRRLPEEPHSAAS